MQLSLVRKGLVVFDASAVDREMEPGAISSVGTLDVSNNSLINVRGMQCLYNLTVLDVSQNSVASLEGLPLSLRRLNASRNNLKKIQGLSPLLQLEWLDVSHNQISSLAGVPATSALRHLAAESNVLTSLWGIEANASLHTLLLQRNLVKKVEDCSPLKGLKNLQQLSLAGNPVVFSRRNAAAVLELLPRSCVQVDFNQRDASQGGQLSLLPGRDSSDLRRPPSSASVSDGSSRVTSSAAHVNPQKQRAFSETPTFSRPKSLSSGGPGDTETTSDLTAVQACLSPATTEQRAPFAKKLIAGAAQPHDPLPTVPLMSTERLRSDGLPSRDDGVHSTQRWEPPRNSGASSQWPDGLKPSAGNGSVRTATEPTGEIRGQHAQVAQTLSWGDLRHDAEHHKPGFAKNANDEHQMVKAESLCSPSGGSSRSAGQPRSGEQRRKSCPEYRNYGYSYLDSSTLSSLLRAADPNDPFSGKSLYATPCANPSVRTQNSATAMSGSCTAAEGASGGSSVMCWDEHIIGSSVSALRAQRLLEERVAQLEAQLAAARADADRYKAIADSATLRVGQLQQTVERQSRVNLSLADANMQLSEQLKVLMSERAGHVPQSSSHPGECPVPVSVEHEDIALAPESDGRKNRRAQPEESASTAAVDLEGAENRSRASKNPDALGHRAKKSHQSKRMTDGVVRVAVDLATAQWEPRTIPPQRSLSEEDVAAPAVAEDRQYARPSHIPGRCGEGESEASARNRDTSSFLTALSTLLSSFASPISHDEDTGVSGGKQGAKTPQSQVLRRSHRPEPSDHDQSWASWREQDATHAAPPAFATWKQ